MENLSNTEAQLKKNVAYKSVFRELCWSLFLIKLQASGVKLY